MLIVNKIALGSSIFSHLFTASSTGTLRFSFLLNEVDKNKAAMKCPQREEPTPGWGQGGFHTTWLLANGFYDPIASGQF